MYIGDKRYAPYVGSTRRKAMTEKALPYDSEVEYLEGTGTQYIQLPLSVSSSSYFEVGGTVIALHPNNNKYSIFGSNPDRQMRAEFYSYYSSTDMNGYASMVGGNPNSGGWRCKVGEKTDFAISTTFVKISETTRELIRPLTDDITAFRIFASYANNNKYPIRICNLYIKVGNVNVYDFIPVRVGNTGYMYDKVSRQLFGNAGTEDFILGPDKKETTVHDYITDGLVFHLDGIEKGATDGSWVDLVGGKVFTANNSTYIQPAVDGFTFIDGSNDFIAMTCSSGLVGTTTWTMESACSPTAWNTSNTRALFTSSNRGCGLSLRGDFHWSSGSNKGWENDILSQQLPKVTLSMNADMGVLNGEQLTTARVGNQMTTSGFQVGSCQNKSYNFVGTIHSIRMYNRSLTLEERLHNQKVDNIRFNLGLNI